MGLFKKKLKLNFPDETIKSIVSHFFNYYNIKKTISKLKILEVSYVSQSTFKNFTNVLNSDSAKLLIDNQNLEKSEFDSVFKFIGYDINKNKYEIILIDPTDFTKSVYVYSIVKIK
jgi:hypothetical protein